MDKIIKIKKSINIKVLYVEDNEQVRFETSSILEQFFDDIDTACDGIDGLEKFKNNEYDLIITDINMPKMNGIDMIKEIKKINKRIPIIVITAFSDFEYLIESIKIGVYGYILKPIDMNQLLESIYRVVDKIRLRKERDEALSLLEQYKNIIDKSTAVTKTDPAGIITYANDAFCKSSGYAKEELIGKPHNIVRHPDMPKSLFKNLWDTIKSKKIWYGIIKNRTKNEKAVYMKATIAPILNKDGDIIEYIAVRHDITDIMNPKKLLRDKIEEIEKPVLLLCKIEDYEDLENLYDSKIIERMEEEFFKKAINLFPKGCSFEYSFNMGNGEFVFLREYDESKSISKFLEDIRIFQENIRKTIVRFDGYEYDIDVILSFAFEKDNIIENARLGIKRAIKEKSDVIWADKLSLEVHKKAKENIEKLKMIKDAINNDRIALHYQPIYNNKTKKIEKYESLVRLIDQEGNIHTPCDFLEVAKIGKYYKQITRIVFDNVLNAAKHIKKELSLNFSAIDIEDRYIRNDILERLKEDKDIAKYLVVELLEDEGIQHVNVVKKFIKELKSLGVKISIDDFGSGYSNFSRLLEYDPDYLKIDASLIKNITTDKSSLNIVETIKNFADKQGYKTIAEFVSDEEIFKIVCELGIDYSQGYYIGKPDVLLHKS